MYRLSLVLPAIFRIYFFNCFILIDLKFVFQKSAVVTFTSKVAIKISILVLFLLCKWKFIKYCDREVFLTILSRPIVCMSVCVICSWTNIWAPCLCSLFCYVKRATCTIRFKIYNWQTSMYIFGSVVNFFTNNISILNKWLKFYNDIMIYWKIWIMQYIHSIPMCLILFQFLEPKVFNLMPEVTIAPTVLYVPVDAQWKIWPI